MEYVNALLLLHDAVNHPIDVRLAAVKEVTELMLFRGSGTTVWLFVEAENSLFEASVPFQRCLRLLGVNFVVETRKISLSTGSDVNEVCHAWLRTRRRTLLPAGTIICPLQETSYGFNFHKDLFFSISLDKLCKCP